MNIGSASSAARWRRRQEIRAEVRVALPPQFLCRREHQHRDAEARDQCDARPERCPICGGLNPGDITHTRCM